MRYSICFLIAAIGLVDSQICVQQDHLIRCNCQTGVEPINNELSSSSVNAVTLVKCNLEELKLPEWVGTLTLEHYPSLNMELPRWPNVTRLEVRNTREFLILGNETFSPLPNLKEILIDTIDLNIRNPLMLFQARQSISINLNNTKLYNSEGIFIVYANDFNLHHSTWDLSRMNVLVYASSISVDRNEFVNLPANSFHFHAGVLSIQNNRFKQIAARGLFIKANGISIHKNRFNSNKEELHEIINVIVPRENSSIWLGSNTWSTNSRKAFAVNFDSGSITERKGFFPEEDDRLGPHRGHVPLVNPTKRFFPDENDYAVDPDHTRRDQQSTTVQPTKIETEDGNSGTLKSTVSSASSGQITVDGAVALPLAFMMIIFTNGIY